MTKSRTPAAVERAAKPSALARDAGFDVYFSADVETDGSIPGPLSMLALALVTAGSFDGERFAPADLGAEVFDRELRPISERFDPDALAVNGLDRGRLLEQGCAPEQAMTEAAEWVRARAEGGSPVLVAYPLSFDWMWLYWDRRARQGRAVGGFSRQEIRDVTLAGQARLRGRDVRARLATGREQPVDALARGSTVLGGWTPNRTGWKAAGGDRAG